MKVESTKEETSFTNESRQYLEVGGVSAAVTTLLGVENEKASTNLRSLPAAKIQGTDAYGQAPEGEAQNPQSEDDEHSS